jgi:hypothetical protein
MQTQFTKFKTTSNADMFDKFEKKHCDLCKRYKLTGYCKVYKKKIKRPDESNCSWFIKLRSI